MESVSSRLQNSMRVENFNSFLDFLATTYSKIWDNSQICDLVFGQPHEMPLEGIKKAIEPNLQAKKSSWFAYKMNEREPREAVSRSLEKEFGMAFDAQDIYLTTGNWCGLTAALSLFVNEGDEVICLSPPWFGYEMMVANQGGKVVKVPLREEDGFDINVELIRGAVTQNTKALLINSPHNPTGKIYPRESLVALGRMLEEECQKRKSPIWMISDEAYKKILFDGNQFESPALHYRYSVMLYTYGKTLLTPGERFGYLVVPPCVDAGVRAGMRPFIERAQMLLGWSFPNATLQHSWEELEKLSIDLANYQAKRDRVIEMLKRIGYQVAMIPQGTFYILVKSPIADDNRFCQMLSKHGVYVLPGKVLQIEGYFRISLTATMEMIEKSEKGFSEAYREWLESTM